MTCSLLPPCKQNYKNAARCHSYRSLVLLVRHITMISFTILCFALLCALSTAFPKQSVKTSCSTSTLTSRVSTSAKTALPWTTTVCQFLKQGTSDTDNSQRLHRLLPALRRASQLATVLSAIPRSPQTTMLLLSQLQSPSLVHLLRLIPKQSPCCLRMSHTRLTL